MGVTIQLVVLYIGTGIAKYAVSIQRHIAKATYRATKSYHVYRGGVTIYITVYRSTEL